MALIVDENGFPIYSRIYKGNIGETQTLKEVVMDLNEKKIGLIDNKKPIMIMDRG